MQFHQQRRRRLWSDDTSATASAEGVLRTLPTSAKRTSGPAETYTSQARRDEQPRLTDLIPTRYRTLLLIYVAGLLVSTALELLYYHIDALSVHVVREALGVFDLASRGSFAAWYSSLLLSITAITAALIFTLRRHRIDDYRGRYRVWIWGTLGYLAMAVNQTADLDDLLREVVEQAATRLSVFQPWIWPALCFAVWLVCVARFSFELHPSRGALVLGWLGAIGWLLSSTGVGFPKLENPASLVMLAVGLKLLGQLTILAAHVAYARYVLLDAHGLLPARRKTDASQPQRRRKCATKRPTTPKRPNRPARRVPIWIRLSSWPSSRQRQLNPSRMRPAKPSRSFPNRSRRPAKSQTTRTTTRTRTRQRTRGSRGPNESACGANASSSASAA